MSYVYDKKIIPEPQLVPALNELSTQGWEAVGVISVGQLQSRLAGAGPVVPAVLMLLKRPADATLPKVAPLPYPESDHIES